MRTKCATMAAFVVALLVTAFAAPHTLSAQEAAVIRGTVVDAQTGEPLAGAQVSIRGTGVGTITNNDGRYLLQNVSPGTVQLRVEYLGFSPQQRTLTVAEGGTLTENFELGVEAIELEALVATGYAQQTRRELSSAISNVGAAEIENTVVASLDAALQGKAAGVQVTQNAGNPGIGMTVRVRGSASISASNQPLYVVDGVPIFQGDFSQLGTGGQDLSAITGLNASEIESIDILKDAAAAAIYGSRGSNGVVMITTKRGAATEGSPRVTVNMSTGLQEASNTLEMLNAAEWMEFMDQAYYNSYCVEEPELGFCDVVGENYATNLVMVDEDGDGVHDFDTDWQDEVLRTAPISNTQVAVNGGDERFKYYLSGTYFDQEGIVIGSAYDRASGRLNLDFNATDRLTLAASLSLSQEENDRVDSDNSIVSPIANAYANEPWAPVIDPATGTFSDWASYSNPVAVGELNEHEARTLRSFGNFTASYGLTNWLRASGRAGFDFLQLREYEYGSPLVDKTYAAGVDGFAQIGNTQARRYVLEGFVTADRILGAHEVSVTAGASTEQDDLESSYLFGEGFTSPELQWPVNAAVPGSVSGTIWEHNLISYFSRANYVYDDRFIFNGSFRADGSSRFGENTRFGYFPAASVAWVVSNEPFMADRFDILSDLKLRGSWGVTGNEAIGNFQFLELYGSANYGDLPGIAPQNLGNPDLKWERTAEWNLGVDASFFADRLGVVAEVYQKDTDDLLLNRPITSTSGFTSVLANIGSIENRGWEASLRTVNLRPSERGGLEWTTTFNITHNTNEVTALAGDNEPFGAGFANRVEVGQPLGFFYLARFEGVDPQTGNAIFTDFETCGEDVELSSELCAGSAEGDKVVVGTTTDPNSGDRTFVGSPHPDYFGGLRNDLSWGMFDLSTFFEYSQGSEIYFGIREYGDDAGRFWDNKFAHVLDYWQEPGDITDTPRPSVRGNSGGLFQSSRFVEDGSYVRLQEVTLGVDLPAVVNQFVRTSNARVYVSGKNLYTWTDYSGNNPDVNSFGSSASASLGTDFYSYPLARTITIGFQGTW